MRPHFNALGTCDKLGTLKWPFAPILERISDIGDILKYNTMNITVFKMLFDENLIKRRTLTWNIYRLTNDFVSFFRVVKTNPVYHILKHHVILQKIEYQRGPIFKCLDRWNDLTWRAIFLLNQIINAIFFFASIWWNFKKEKNIWVN